MTQDTGMAAAYVFAKVYDTERQKGHTAEACRKEALAAIEKFNDFVNPRVAGGSSAESGSFDHRTGKRVGNPAAT